MRGSETLARRIAHLVQARLNCQESGNGEWFERHGDRLDWIARELLPSGSGVDNGTRIDLDASTGEKLVLHAAFHHMDEGGGYDGWTEHPVTVRASLVYDLDIRIGGRNRNGVKEHLHELISHALSQPAPVAYPEGL